MATEVVSKSQPAPSSHSWKGAGCPSDSGPTGDGPADHRQGGIGLSGTRIRIEVLQLELGKRGWNFVDLARAAGISPATLSAANHGARISPRTLRRIAEALNRQPVIPAAEDLIAS